MTLKEKPDGIIISASILSSNFARLQDEIEAVDRAGADWIHLDIMDGHFVPNITYGMPVIKSIRKYSNKPFDTHLMIENPSRYIDAFIDAGSDIITIHYEADMHLNRSIEYIKSKGKKAGVSLNPSTPVSVLEDIISFVDMVLIMTVNPGFAAQSLVPTSYTKVAKARSLIDLYNPSAILQVDGGVNADTCSKLIASGATSLVAGNFIFSSSNYAKAIEQLKLKH